MTIKKDIQEALDEKVTAGGEELIIVALRGKEMYKYLGMEQKNMTEKETVKKRLCEEFQSRIQVLCTSKLNSGNLTKAINTYAVSALTWHRHRWAAELNVRDKNLQSKGWLTIEREVEETWHNKLAMRNGENFRKYWWNFGSNFNDVINCFISVTLSWNVTWIMSPSDRDCHIISWIPSPSSPR